MHNDSYPLTDFGEIGILRRMQSDRLKRREFITLLAGAAAWQLGALTFKYWQIAHG